MTCEKCIYNDPKRRICILHSIATFAGNYGDHSDNYNSKQGWLKACKNYKDVKQTT